jgi:hypothetical protein
LHITEGKSRAKGTAAIVQTEAMLSRERSEWHAFMTQLESGNVGSALIFPAAQVLVPHVVTAVLTIFSL